MNASVRDVVTPTYEVSQGLVYLRKLEVQVAFSCNLSCSGCVHGSPASRAKFIDVGCIDAHPGLVPSVFAGGQSGYQR